MKAEKLKKDFNPVTLTLETQEEFNFLLGLLNAVGSQQKQNCDYYDKDINRDMWKLLYDLK